MPVMKNLILILSMAFAISCSNEPLSDKAGTDDVKQFGKCRRQTKTPIYGNQI
jgi:hypothetical protein